MYSIRKTSSSAGEVKVLQESHFKLPYHSYEPDFQVNVYHEVYQKQEQEHVKKGKKH